MVGVCVCGADRVKLGQGEFCTSSVSQKVFIEKDAALFQMTMIFGMLNTLGSPDTL